MIETIQKWSELKKELKELGVIGVSLFDNEIHFGKEKFCNQFKGMEIQIEDCLTDEYPYRISVEVSGIFFFARCDLQELEKYFPELVPQKEDDYARTNG